jgi:hypothetical protein
VSRVYSTQFHQERNSTGWTYTNVGTFVVVVRDIDAFFGGGIVGGAANFVGTEGQTFAYFPFTGLDSAVFSWRGRQVFNPGDTFGMTTSSGTGLGPAPGVDVMVSGYLLSPT